jgi:RimJ/RimL family protein N-acetyltransferase
MKLEFTTDRLILRSLEETDLEDFLEYRSDPEIARYQSFEPFNREEAAAYIACMKDRQFGGLDQWVQLAIVLKSNSKLIGDCGVGLSEQDGLTAEIGCSISRAYQGNGYAAEALSAVMKFLFETAEVSRVIAVTDVLNGPSIKMIEALGFKDEDRVTKDVIFKGSPGKEFHYVFAKERWGA